MHKHMAAMAAAAAAASRKPCVYMLNEGRCARADCRFVHDLKTIVCKYWLEGECLKGETCEFAHEYVQTPTNDDDSHSGKLYISIIFHKNYFSMSLYQVDFVQNLYLNPFYPKH
jgi:hypothetical protein